MAIPRDTSSAIAIFILLLVSLSELPWSRIEALIQDCHAPEVTEDQTGMMIFFIDRRVDFSSDHFFANLIRSDEPDWDILNCDQPNGTSHVGCKINSPKFKSRGVMDHKLTVFIPNITQHYADTYVFQVYINSIAQPPVFCSVSVKKRLHPDMNRVIKAETTTSPWVIAGVLAICSLTLVLFAVVLKRTRGHCIKNNEQSDNQQPPEDQHGTEMPLMNAEERSNVLMTEVDRDLTDKLWYHKGIQDREANRLLWENRNIEGTFLVMSNITKDGFKVGLRVRVNKDIRKYNIRHGGNGFWLEKDVFFETVSELITCYQHKKGSLPVQLVIPRMDG